MKDFISDLIRDSRGGKASSKKIWGHITMFLVCGAFVMDGLHIYEVNETLFGYMLIGGCTLLGLRIAKDILRGLFNRKEETK